MHVHKEGRAFGRMGEGGLRGIIKAGAPKSTKGRTLGVSPERAIVGTRVRVLEHHRREALRGLTGRVVGWLYGDYVLFTQRRGRGIPRRSR